MAAMPLHRAAPRSPARRRLLQGVSGACALALVRPSRSDDASTSAMCSASSAAPNLWQPGNSGYLGRLTPGAAPLVLRAGQAGSLPPNVRHGALAFHALQGGAAFVNPTLVVRRGETLRVALDNALDAPTIVHWHGLTVDTRNDGGGMPLVEPGQRYEYAFEVRNRGALYWYHPHPHGLTAGQVHDGLYGLIDVEDDDTLALRRELDLAPGSSELLLVLQDRSGSERYARTTAQAIHGVYGDALYVNGASCAQVDVGTRLYRLRVVNACNARTLLLGLRTAAGTSMPFDVIGNDGGLLPAPVLARSAFLGTAERLDILVDLRDAAIGDTIVLETRAFDPMHAEVAMPKEEANAGDMHAMHHHGDMSTSAHAGHATGAWPEGAPRDILQLRVRTRVAYDRRVPSRLSALDHVDVANARERPLRLGYKSGQWRINDRVFAMGETPIEVARESTEVWLLRNYFTSMPHAMHLHGFSFEVLERETSPDQVKALAIDGQGRLASDLGRKDTILVWPGESVRVALRFALPFDGPQTYPFHCHNLEHEDGGMMLGVRVA
jgi:suppressor of ftsI/bilirubin oxidase